MAKYQIKLNDTGEVIDLNVITAISFTGKQKILVYESPGTNGGVSLSNGRETNKITLTGRLVLTSVERVTYATDPLEALHLKKIKLEEIRDSGDVITLITPITNNDTGQYLIETLTFDSISPSSMAFSLTIVEYRQKNFVTSQSNLIAVGPKETMIARAHERGLF